jgi:hypothetical protein
MERPDGRDRQPWRCQSNLIAWALQIPDKYLFRVAQDYAAVNLLTIEDGAPRVELMNHMLA